VCEESVAVLREFAGAHVGAGFSPPGGLKAAATLLPAVALSRLRRLVCEKSLAVLREFAGAHVGAGLSPPDAYRLPPHFYQP